MFVELALASRSEEILSDFDEVMRKVPSKEVPEWDKKE